MTGAVPLVNEMIVGCLAAAAIRGAISRRRARQAIPPRRALTLAPAPHGASAAAVGAAR
jgi:hypothetical protein